MKCVLYARVSTQEQAELDLSIPAQVQAMRDYAAQREWTVAEEFIEPGISARTADRPVLQRMLGSLRQRHDDIGVVLVHKVDRLARNVSDHATIRALLKQLGIRLASVVENVDDSVSGQLVENIMASIAQFYSGNLGEEVKKGMRQKVLKGGWPHLPPRGYVSVRNTRTGAARVEIHPEDGLLMQRAFELYASGWFSLKALAAKLAREGLTARNGRPLAAQYMKRLLSNVFFTGQIQWKGLQVAGAHEALISQQLFEKVQAAMRARFNHPGVKGSVRGFVLRGLAICASCRGHMTAGIYRKRWRYYQCSRRNYDKNLCSSKKYCPAEAAHRAIDEICSQLRLSDKTIGLIATEANAELLKHHEAGSAAITSLAMKRTRLLELEAKLTQAFVAGDVSPESYRATASKYRADIIGLETALSQLQVDPSRVTQGIQEMLQRTHTVAELGRELPEDKRVRMLRDVFESIVLDKSGVVGFTLRPPFDSILKAAPLARADSHQADEIRTIAVDVLRHAKDLPTLPNRIVAT